MQEVLRLIDIAAWPIVALIVIFRFEKPLLQLFPLVRKFKAGSVEFEFDQKVHEVQLSYESKNDNDHYLSSKDLLHLSKSDPRQAIHEAWRTLELYLKRAVIRNSGSPILDTSTSFKTIQSLEYLGLLKDEDLALAKQLRGLKNEADLIRGFDISEQSAASYIAMSDILIEALKKSGLKEELL